MSSDHAIALVNSILVNFVIISYHYYSYHPIIIPIMKHIIPIMRCLETGSWWLVGGGRIGRWFLVVGVGSWQLVVGGSSCSRAKGRLFIVTIVIIFIIAVIAVIAVIVIVIVIIIACA